MYEYSTEGLVADAVPMWRVGRALRGGRAWNSTTTCTLPRLCVVGGFLDHVGCAEKHIFSWHRASNRAVYARVSEQSTPDRALNTVP